jgi:hypothetical protein
MECAQVIEQATRDMIGWLLDCFESDEEQEEIRAMDFHCAKRAVARYYAGGYYQFIKDARLHHCQQNVCY